MTIYFCDVTPELMNHDFTRVQVFTSTQDLLLGLNQKIPDVIVLRFSRGLYRLSQEMLNLCCFLRTAESFRPIQLIGFLDWPNQELGERLGELGIDVLVFSGVDSISEDQIIHEVQRAGLPPGKFISQLCPFLHFEQFNGDQEICLCGADRNRLVINRQRMQRFCGGSGHTDCPYFMDPQQL